MRACLERIREKTPLIHNITNYVTINDVANAVLACGGSPIMAEAKEEVEEITSGCDGLNINIGMLNKEKAQAMLLAGIRAGQKGHVILLDPVGVGGSSFRRSVTEELLEKINFTAIRGNISEIKTLALGYSSSRGVDAAVGEDVTEENVRDMAVFVKEFSERTGSIIAVTGNIDLVADAKKCYVIRNGRPEMGRITGTGCQLSGIMTTFLAANREQPLKAAAASVCMMGLAGQIAWEHMREGEGNATFKNRMMDAISLMDGEMLERGANYEIF